jgi:WD40 repeat protein
MQNDYPEVQRVLKGHKESITALDFHPRCKSIISAGMDSYFYVWDLKNHNQPHKYEGFKVYNDINYIGTST